MTPGQAKQLAHEVRALDREIGALRLEALSRGWTVATGLLVVQLTHRYLDRLDEIEHFLTERDTIEAKEKERTASAIMRTR